MSESDRRNVLLIAAEQDKSFARELAGALQAVGFGVWFEAAEVKVGDSVTEKLNDALGAADHGVVLVSPAFLAAGPAHRPMRALEALGTPLLPVLHGVDRTEMQRSIPSLADIEPVSGDGGAAPAAVQLVRAMLDSFDGLVAALPGWEDPLFRFLEGRGELQQADRFMVFTLWELLLDSDVRYPVWLAGRLFERVDLLDAAFNCLGGARAHAASAVGDAGVEALRQELCSWAGGVDPFELG